MDISGTTIGKPQTARDLTHEYVFMSLTIYIIYSDVENICMGIRALLGISEIAGSYEVKIIVSGETKLHQR